jgi:RNA polymerase sigma-70 factor (ECF subfamily)
MEWEEKFLKKLAEGSLSCLQKFVKIVQTKAFRIAYNIVREKEYAMEAVQEGIIKFYAAIKEKRLSEDKNIEFYFYRCVRNCAIDIYRRNKLYLDKNFSTIEGEPLNNDFDVGKGEDYITQLYKVAQAKRLWKLIDKLPTKLKEVLLMIEYEGMKPEEVAQVTQSNLNTVRWRLFRAKEILREMLKSQFIKEGLRQ